jgi:DNA-binding transcriptional MerR regulator
MSLRREVKLMEFDIDPAQPVYVIGVVSQLVRLPVWTLRILDREGLVKPKRRVGRARLYSLDDVRRLIRIRQLYQERRVNTEGVRIILQMEQG